METMVNKSELIRHLKARIKLSDLLAENLQSKGAHTNAQKAYSHRDAYQNLLAMIDVESTALDVETDRINVHIKELELEKNV
ncbi:hypothetical protein [Vibrio vulnificus]|uniref:hypothetical protein n=1 Tax=Vibrio vulnificus TaxID=672 RepID=UPI001029CD25|nr:hypothetical protein [Vibrio vulnificus]RZP88973.1 hypothetical protein D8T54_20310 [Vibrio vulnificus]